MTFYLWGLCNLAIIARSSNGRTPGFGPGSGGSNPPRATSNKKGAF